MKLHFPGLASIFSICFVSSATAVTINLTTDELVDGRYVGFITPASGSPTAEAGYINTLTALTNDGIDDGGAGDVLGPSPWATHTFDLLSGGDYYDRSINNPWGAGAAPTAVAGTKNDNSQDTFTLTNYTGYILGKYDAQNAGSAVWYLENFTGDIDLQDTFNGRGLSHTSFLGKGGPGRDVPDGGRTIALLGTALLGLAGFRRLKARKA